MPSTRTHPARLIVPLLAIPAVAVTVVAGVWVTGGVITNDFHTSMALTAVWFALTGAACVAVAWRSRRLRLPVLGAYIVTVAVVGGYLGLSTLRDRVVDERVVTATAPPAAAAAEARPRNVEVAAGRLRSHEHETRGTVRVVRLADGRRFLTLTRFSTAVGPDLRVRLVPGDSSDGGASGAIDLGGLKGNRGDQQYELPGRARLADHTVVIWCRTFSAAFGSAVLRATAPAGEER